jgi:hypothetical protein
LRWDGKTLTNSRTNKQKIKNKICKIRATRV